MAGLDDRNRFGEDKAAVIAGIALATVFHVLIIALCLTSGLKYLYPPPPEQSMLVEFIDVEPEIEVPEQITYGTQPRAADATPEDKLELVQKSEAQMQGTGANEAPEATTGEDGDVEVPEPPRKVEINRRALFHAPENDTDKDTLAPQAADKVSDALKAGHALGNTVTGKTSGEPDAKLKGRTVVGTLPKPSYNVQNSGKVVVDILVDRYGNVTAAVPGGEGTTVTDKTLWEAARKAALNTQFNVKADAPAQQAGTITYVFTLK